ncbi:MAG: hypothetical protein Q8941_22880 [Bacteroidota bacterium]|nr:hypothetical protein [Bacteroidota bacterium]
MKNVEAVLSVKFTSTFSPGILANAFQADLETFRNVPGLIQKYIATEEHKGVINEIYLFESKSARAAFWTSELARRIPAKYGLIPGTLRVEQYDLAMTLNDAVLN